uniref:Uncharacterized protein n=1 Tax=Plectus sambesii TaxID=2011161 RepID=A0A914XHR3_9BILA
MSGTTGFYQPLLAPPFRCPFAPVPGGRPHDCFLASSVARPPVRQQLTIIRTTWPTGGGGGGVRSVLGRLFTINIMTII